MHNSVVLTSLAYRHQCPVARIQPLRSTNNSKLRTDRPPYQTVGRGDPRVASVRRKLSRPGDAESPVKPEHGFQNELTPPGRPDGVARCDDAVHQDRPRGGVRRQKPGHRHVLGVPCDLNHLELLASIAFGPRKNPVARPHVSSQHLPQGRGSGRGRPEDMVTGQQKLGRVSRGDSHGTTRFFAVDFSKEKDGFPLYQTGERIGRLDLVAEPDFRQARRSDLALRRANVQHAPRGEAQDVARPGLAVLILRAADAAACGVGARWRRARRSAGREGRRAKRRRARRGDARGGAVLRYERDDGVQKNQARHDTKRGSSDEEQETRQDENDSPRNEKIVSDLRLSETIERESGREKSELSQVRERRRNFQNERSIGFGSSAELIVLHFSLSCEYTRRR